MRKSIGLFLALCLLSGALFFASVPAFADDATPISSAEAFAALMNDSTMWSGDYVLTADIDLSGVAQTPIGNSTTPFIGSLDGDGHTISGISITSGVSNVGLFGYTRDTSISNLTISGAVNVPSATVVGGLIGYAELGLTLSNIVNNVNVTGQGKVGGFVGHIFMPSANMMVGESNFINCVNNGTITCGAGGMGGGIFGRFELAGQNMLTTLSRLRNNGTVDVTGTSGGSYAGGIAGIWTTKSPTTIDSCLNTGDITGTYKYVGGFAGYFRCYVDSNTTLQNCMNTGMIHTGATAAAGLLGAGNGANYIYTVDALYNTGSVTSENAAPRFSDYINPVTSAYAAKAVVSNTYYSSTDNYSNNESHAVYVADPTVKASFSGFDFDTSPKWSMGIAGPELTAFHTHNNAIVTISNEEHTYYCTCGQEGATETHNYIAGVCTVCGVVETNCGHENTHDVITTAATCVATGLKDVVCDDCGNTVQSGVEVPVDPTNHVGDLALDFDRNGCSEIDYYCTACSEVVVVDTSSATDVYVASTGAAVTFGNVSAGNLLGRSTNPFANFADAMQYAAYSATRRASGVTVHIVDSAVVPANYNSPVCDYCITITGDDMGELNFNYSLRRFFANSDVTFEHLTFKSNATDGVSFFGQNHNFTFGEGIVMGNAGTLAVTDFASINNFKAHIFGGFESTATPAVMDTNLTVRSGEYWFIGGWNRNGTSTSGTGMVTVGKTDANDILRTNYLVPYSTGAQLLSADSEATVVIDGEIDIKTLLIGTQNENSGYALDPHCFTSNYVLAGDISPNYPSINGGLGVDLNGSPQSHKVGINNVYVDERVAEAIVDSYAFFGDGNSISPDSAVATMGYPTTYYTYIQYCGGVLGGHIINGGVCTRCGFDTSYEHTNTHEEITLVPTCTAVGSKNIVCDDCFAVIETIELPIDANNHDAIGSLWSYDSENNEYVLTCGGCGAELARQAALPTVYVQNYVTPVGNDANVGTLEAPLYTLEEAVARLVQTGGTVSFKGRYVITSDITLPAWEGTIAFTGSTNDSNGNATSGFFIGAAKVVLSLGGDSVFNNIVFKGRSSSENSEIYIAANWNDIEMGYIRVHDRAVTRLIAGYNARTTDDLDAKTVSVTVNGAAMSSGAGDYFYNYIYLGDFFGAGGVKVANKTVNFNANNGTVLGAYNMTSVIDVLYAMSTSGTAGHESAQVENCSTVINLNDNTTVNRGRSGDRNVSYYNSKGQLDSLVLNFNDNAQIGTNYQIKNVKNAIINVSSLEDGRTTPITKPITFYALGDFADTDATVTANYDSHSFAQDIAAPFVVDVYCQGKIVLTENCADACVWDEGTVTTAPTAVSGGACLYTCQVCGKQKTEEIACPTSLSLSGVYTDGNGKLRFVTRVTTAGDPDIEYFGTYIVPLSYFTEHELIAGGGEQPGVAAIKYTQSIASGASFAADLTDIPGTYFDTPIFAWSFVKFHGIDTVYTQVLGSFTVSGARLVKGGF